MIKISKSIKQFERLQRITGVGVGGIQDCSKIKICSSVHSFRILILQQDNISRCGFLSLMLEID